VNRPLRASGKILTSGRLFDRFRSIRLLLQTGNNAAVFRQTVVFDGNNFLGNLELRLPFRNRADFLQHEDSAGEQ
jgi:hypothetical protein